MSSTPSQPTAATPAETSSSTSSSSSSSTSSSRNYVLIASYATIGVVWAASQYVLIPYVVHLLVLVTAILYAACHGSLILLNKQHVESEDEKDADGKDKANNTNNAASTEPAVERETLKASDAYQFPLVGSVSLFSLYCAFKFLGKEWVNLLIGTYFGLIGTAAVSMTLGPVLVALVRRTFLSPLAADMHWHHALHHPYAHIKNKVVVWLGLVPETNPVEWEIVFNLTEVVAGLLSVALVGLYYYWEKPWYLNNILGISFCLQGIERFSLGTYKIGAILLVGLFFYDIFWVFGTDVMVTVAKNLDGPIKILLPRTLAVDDVTGKLKDLSLLGLGDIVIPGFFLALLLRFDAHRAFATVASSTTTASDGSSDKAAKPVAVHHLPLTIGIHDSFAKPYFHTALAAYVAGLGLTLFIMMKFNAAQPALLYLVPACLGSSFVTALVRGEIKELLAYSEEVDEEEDEKIAGEGGDAAGTNTAGGAGDETKKEK